MPFALHPQRWYLASASCARSSTSIGSTSQSWFYSSLLSSPTYCGRAREVNIRIPDATNANYVIDTLHLFSKEQMRGRLLDEQQAGAIMLCCVRSGSLASTASGMGTGAGNANSFSTE